jgi:hypothetical protein
VRRRRVYSKTTQSPGHLALLLRLQFKTRPQPSCGCCWFTSRGRKRRVHLRGTGEDVEITYRVIAEYLLHRLMKQNTHVPRTMCPIPIGFTCSVIKITLPAGPGGGLQGCRPSHVPPPLGKSLLLWDFGHDSGGYEEFYRLRHNAMKSVGSQTTFRRDMSPSSSQQNSPRNKLL